MGLAGRYRIEISNEGTVGVVEAAPPKGATADDALACAKIARSIRAGHARPFPRSTEARCLRSTDRDLGVRLSDVYGTLTLIGTGTV
jgi:hypothetical protein